MWFPSPFHHLYSPTFPVLDKGTSYTWLNLDNQVPCLTPPSSSLLHPPNQLITKSYQNTFTFFHLNATTLSWPRLLKEPQNFPFHSCPFSNALPAQQPRKNFNKRKQRIFYMCFLNDVNVLYFQKLLIQQR